MSKKTVDDKKRPRLVVTTYATAGYVYALEAQAGLLVAALRYAGYEKGEALWLLACDGSREAAAAYAKAVKRQGGWMKVEKLTLKGCRESPDGKHARGSNLTIAGLQDLAFNRARELEADLAWSVEADILPEANTLRCLMDALMFDRGYYGVAMAGYPNDSFLGGYGTPSNWILPTVYEDERKAPVSLSLKRAALEKRRAAKKALTEKEAQEYNDLLAEWRKLPAVGNVFELNAKGWRPRGWLEAAYPGVGLGAMLPTSWVGLGCTLLSARALDAAQFTGYEGNGTQDLWLCWKAWHPRGIRMTVVPHALCSHVKRREGERLELLHSHHVMEGAAYGHLRMTRKPWPAAPGDDAAPVGE